MAKKKIVEQQVGDVAPDVSGGGPPTRGPGAPRPVAPEPPPAIPGMYGDSPGMRAARAAGEIGGAAAGAVAGAIRDSQAAYSRNSPLTVPQVAPAVTPAPVVARPAIGDIIPGNAIPWQGKNNPPVRPGSPAVAMAAAAPPENDGGLQSPEITPDAAGRAAYLKNFPVGSIRASLPGQVGGRDQTFASVKDFYDATQAAGGRPSIPPSTGDFLPQAPGVQGGRNVFAPSPPNARDHWNGGPSYDEVYPNRGAASNIFSMIDAAMPGGTPDSRVYDRLGNVAGGVSQFMRDNDSLRSRTIETETDNGPMFFRTAAGQLVQRRRVDKRHESVGDLSSAAANMFGHGAGAFQAADTDRTAQRGQDLGLVGEGMRQGGETERSRIGQETSFGVADRGLAGTTYSADQRATIAEATANAKKAKLESPVVVEAIKMATDPETGQVNTELFKKQTGIEYSSLFGEGGTQQPVIREGTRGSHKGRPVVYKGGRWVPLQ